MSADPDHNWPQPGSAAPEPWLLAVRALQHELNNALAPIAGLAQLARASRHDRELQELALARAARAGDEATAICQTVLSLFAQLPAPGVSVRDARRVVGELVASRRRLRLDIEYVEMFHVEHVPVDATGLGMVVLNLLLNAEAACADAGRIDVRLSRSDERASDGPVGDDRRECSTSYNQSCGELFVIGRGRGVTRDDASARERVAGGENEGGLAGAGESADQGVVVEVIDSGRGMSRSELAAAVGGSAGGSDGASRGGRSGGAGASRRQGLGLMICRRVLAAAGGKMVVRSRAGEGTLVRVWWPEASVTRSPGGVAA